MVNTIRKATVTLEYHPNTHKPYVLLCGSLESEQRFWIYPDALQAASDYLKRVTQEPKGNL